MTVDLSAFQAEYEQAIQKDKDIEARRFELQDQLDALNGELRLLQVEADALAKVTAGSTVRAMLDGIFSTTIDEGLKK